MPINDPIRRRKIAPASLAFPAEGRRTGQQVSYQQTVVQQVSASVSTDVATLRDVRHMGEVVNNNIIDAEDRSKKFVGEYMHVTEWDIAHDLMLTMMTMDPIGFAQPVIHCLGAQFSGTIAAADARWFHRVGKGQQGIWWYHAALHLSVPDSWQIMKALLIIFKNNTTYRVIDALDAEMTGNKSSIFCDDIILRGGCHVPLDVGDELDVRIFLDSPLGVGNGLLTYPSSVYGYVTGHREACDTTFLGSVPTTGVDFVFR